MFSLCLTLRNSLPVLLGLGAMITCQCSVHLWGCRQTNLSCFGRVGRWAEWSRRASGKDSQLLNLNIGYWIKAGQLKQLSVSQFATQHPQAKISNLIINIQLREVPDLYRVGPDEDPVLIVRLEVLHSLHNPIAVPVGLIQLDPHKESVPQVHDLPHIAYLAPRPSPQLASGADFYCCGQFAQILRVQLLSRESSFVHVNDIGVVLQELLLPLPEVFREIVVVLIRDHVLLYSLVILNFLQDGIGVQVNNVDAHARLSPIVPQGQMVLIQLCYQLVLFIFELQFHVGDNGAVASLYILLDSQDSLVEVKARLEHFTGADIMLDAELDSCVLHQVFHRL